MGKPGYRKIACYPIQMSPLAVQRSNIILEKESEQVGRHLTARRVCDMFATRDDNDEVHFSCGSRNLLYFR